jgi:hypothetical protein
MEKPITRDKYSRKKKTPEEASHKVISEEITDLEVAKKMMKIFQSAVDRNLEFNLSFVTVKKLLSYKTCYYTNRLFDEEGQFSRSFDRIDSSKGYVEGNVVACTVDINGKKSNLSVEEIIALYNKLAKDDKRTDHRRDSERGIQDGNPEGSLPSSTGEDDSGNADV